MINTLFVSTIFLIIDRVTATPIIVPITVALLAKTNLNKPKLAFWLGIITDFILGNYLGSHSLMFLFFLIQTHFYSTRFPIDNWWSIALFGTIASIESQLVFTHSFNFSILINQIIITLVSWVIYSIVEGRGQSGEVFLKSND